MFTLAGRRRRASGGCLSPAVAYWRGSSRPGRGAPHHGGGRVERSLACPLDLHALLPLPNDVLSLGPTDTAALAWTAAHWDRSAAPGTSGNRPKAAPDVHVVAREALKDPKFKVRR